MVWFIKIHRKIIESEIWDKPSSWLKIWLYLISNVFHKDGKIFKIWENYFTYETIEKSCWVSKETVKNCLRFLEVHQQIHRQKQSRGVIIKVINYKKYHDTTPTTTLTGTPTNREECKEYIYKGTLENLIEDWNGLKNDENKWKQTRKVTNDLKEVFRKFRLEYTKQDFNDWVNKYLDDIEARDSKTSYKDHRFNLYEFLKQKNWLQKFINT